MSPMEQLKRSRGWQRGAFTLVEMMISAALFGLVTAGSFGVYIMCQKLWRATTLSTDTARTANLAIERMLYGVGTNNGLRSAASVVIETNWHTYMTFTNYWNTPGGKPPAATHWCNNLSPTSWEQDGCWRLICSNAFDGVTWIDYIKKQRAIVMWPDINNPASRLSIANYVVDAFVSTNATIIDTTAGGIGIMVTTWKRDGNFIASNQASIVIIRRNN